MPFDSALARQHIQGFNFKDLFVEVLGWSQPAREIKEIARDGATYRRRQVAQLSGVVVFEVTAADGRIPELARVVTKAAVRTRVRLALCEQVGPMSLHLAVVRIGWRAVPLVDVLFDTTDSDLNLAAFCHVDYHRGIGELVTVLGNLGFLDFGLSIAAF